MPRLPRVNKKFTTPTLDFSRNGSGKDMRDSVKLLDEEGNAFHVSPLEIEEVVENMINRAMVKHRIQIDKDIIQEVATVRRGLRGHIDEQMKLVEDKTFDYLDDVIDRIAEKVAKTISTSAFEQRVNERVKEKLEIFLKSLE
jgi:restriction endonuclease Mrr